MNNQMSTETLQTKMGKTLAGFFFFPLPFRDTQFVLCSSVICLGHLFVTQLNSTARSTVRGLWLCPVTDTDPLQGPDSVLVKGLAVCDLKDQTSRICFCVFPSLHLSLIVSVKHQPSKHDGAENV